MKKYSVITISEGAAGMKSQIEGLASLISDHYINIDLKINFFLKNLPVQLIPSKSFIINNINDFKIIKPTVLISCGKKSVKASIALKNKFKNIFNIHIQDPKTSYNKFDLIVAPKHDNLNFYNTISTDFALHNIKFNTNKNKNNKTINFIIGGKTKNFQFSKITQEKIYQDIKNLSKKHFVQIIPSRRTPKSLIKKIKSNKINNSNLYENSNNPQEYGNFISTSAANIVTWESISMISECVSSGVGTFIYSFEKGSIPSKYKLFHKDLINKGYIKNFNYNIKPFKVSIGNELQHLKNKILNKIEQSPIFNV
ncbi:MAG: hypothetical protein CMI90_06080 [Pelagibacteraceae bacterium]|nr:hypothetical protein [Pelagibacteraceae bacterium]